MSCSAGTCQASSTGGATTLAANEVGSYMAVDASCVYRTGTGVFKQPK